MIINALKDIIDIVPELINLFLSGFVFMYVYIWLNNKKIDLSLMTLWSLFISALVKSFCSVLHTLILPTVMIPDAAKILVFTVTGFLLAILFTYLSKTKPFTILLYKINNKSINDDIFEDIIDYDKQTMLQIYLKNSDCLYIGTFKMREEKGLDSYIVLIDYASLNKTTKEIIFMPSENDKYSTVAINLRDIERIELIYEHDSKVWKRLSGNT